MKIILKKMKLENFKSVKERTIDFLTRTDIKGQNATGKTTIADAFMWVLFNKMSDGTQPDKIRPHDEDGNDIDFIDISVEIVLDIDGKENTIKKVQKQKWTTPRGKSEQRFDGNKNEYEVNTIPKTERDFRAYFDTIIAEDVFRFSSSANSFMSLKPKERRKKLFELVSDVTDSDVIASNPELAPVKDMLAEFTVEELMSRNSKALKEYNKKLVEIPARIDEVAKSIVEVDVKKNELIKKELLKKIEEIEKQEEGISEAGDAVTEVTDKIMEIKLEMNGIATKENDELVQRRRQIQKKIDDIDSSFTSAELEQIRKQKELEQTEKAMADYTAQRDEAGKQYMEVSKRTFAENNLICPACGQEYPAAKKEELRETFKEHNRIELENISKKGFELKAKIEEEGKKKSGLSEKIEALKEEKLLCIKQLKEEREKLASTPSEADLSANAEYNNLKQQLKQLEEQLSGMSSTSEYRQQLKEKKQELKQELEKVQDILNKSSANKKAEQRMEELKAEQKDTAQRIADAEKEQFLLEQFNSAKVSMLTDKINANFNVVKWRLFEQQINGGYKEICEPTIGGTLYNNGLNKGHRVAAELDIIATLQKINNVSVPVFLDDCERINTWNIPEMECQLITLTRTDDFELKVEGE